MDGIVTKEFEDLCFHSIGLIDQNREYLQMHLSELKDERIGQALLDIGVESARLERAMSEMLSLLEVSAGEGSTAKERPLCWFDLCQTLRSAEGAKEAILCQTGVKLTVKTTLDHAWLYADAERTEQILFHLLSNALRACASGKKVELGLEKKADVYLLTVTDNGCGLPKEENWQENHRRFLGGAKLGLRLCRVYCEQAGWDLSVHDRKSRGTQAELRIPLPPEDAEVLTTVDLHSSGAVEAGRLQWLLEREARVLSPAEK